MVVWWHILWFNTLIQSVMSNKNPVFCSNSMFCVCLSNLINLKVVAFLRFFDAIR